MSHAPPDWPPLAWAPPAIPPAACAALPPRFRPTPTAKASDLSPGATRSPTSTKACIGGGAALLLMLCLVPIWNALALLQDANYVFWQGTAVPKWLIGLCLGVVLLYVITATLFFRYCGPQAHTEQTTITIANVFITLLGLELMLLSLPLSRQATDTYSNLMHRCDFTAQTHRVYEYSQVLHNIRGLPACASKYSVEECSGYEDAPPYTAFLKTMENEFRCSGFCFQSPGVAAPAIVPIPPVAAASSASAGASAPAPAPAPAPVQSPALAPFGAHGKSAAASLHRARRQGLGSVDRRVGLLATDAGRKSEAGTTASAIWEQQTADVASQYPPTLFSDANYQASCERMAARDIRNFAGDVGYQTFFQGVYLVMIAVITGFLRIVGLCVRRDPDTKAQP